MTMGGAAHRHHNGAWPPCLPREPKYKNRGKASLRRGTTGWFQSHKVLYLRHPVAMRKSTAAAVTAAWFCAGEAHKAVSATCVRNRAASDVVPGMHNRSMVFPPLELPPRRHATCLPAGKKGRQVALSFRAPEGRLSVPCFHPRPCRRRTATPILGSAIVRP